MSWLAKVDVSEIFSVMASIALTPEASAVRIIVFMTGVAIRRLIDFRFHGFVVALPAAEVLVCALQHEICLLIVLKNPYTPVVRVMA